MNNSPDPGSCHPPEGEPLAKRTKTGGAAPKILVVEDEILSAYLLREELLLAGYEVPAVAATGEEAVQLALELHPNLILMDIKLRGAMNGIEAAAEIVRSQPLPIIFVTANTDPQTIAQAKKIGVFGFLPKPVNTATMISTIEMALFKHKADTDLLAQKQKSFEDTISTNTVKLEDANTALKVVVEQWKSEQNDVALNILTNIKKLISPAVQALKNTPLNEGQRVMIEAIDRHLQQLCEAQLSASGGHLSLLSSTESQVAHYVKAGKSTKEIAQFLNIAASTINTHRDSIRKKLGIKNTKTNLKKELQKML